MTIRFFGGRFLLRGGLPLGVDAGLASGLLLTIRLFFGGLLFGQFALAAGFGFLLRQQRQFRLGRLHAHQRNHFGLLLREGHRQHAAGRRRDGNGARLRIGGQDQFCGPGRFDFLFHGRPGLQLDHFGRGGFRHFGRRGHLARRFDRRRSLGRRSFRHRLGDRGFDRRRFGNNRFYLLGSFLFLFGFLLWLFLVRLSRQRGLIGSGRGQRRDFGRGGRSGSFFGKSGRFGGRRGRLGGFNRDFRRYCRRFGLGGHNLGHLSFGNRRCLCGHRFFHDGRDNFGGRKFRNQRCFGGNCTVCAGLDNLGRRRFGRRDFGRRSFGNRRGLRGDCFFRDGRDNFGNRRFGRRDFGCGGFRDGRRFCRNRFFSGGSFGRSLARCGRGRLRGGFDRRDFDLFHHRRGFRGRRIGRPGQRGGNRRRQGGVFFADLRGLFQHRLLLQQGQHGIDHQFFGGFVLRFQLALQRVRHNVLRDALPAVGLPLDELGDGRVAVLGQLDEAVLGFPQQGLHRGVGKAHFFGARSVRRRIEHVRPMLAQIFGRLDGVAGVDDDIVPAGNLVDRSGEGIAAAHRELLELRGQIFRNPGRAGGLQLHLQIILPVEPLGASGRSLLQNVREQNGPGPGTLRAAHQRGRLDLRIGVLRRRRTGGPGQDPRHHSRCHRQDQFCPLHVHAAFCQMLSPLYSVVLPQIKPILARFRPLPRGTQETFSAGRPFAGCSSGRSACG